MPELPASSVQCESGSALGRGSNRHRVSSDRNRPVGMFHVIKRVEVPVHDLEKWAQCNGVSFRHRKGAGQDLMVYGEAGGPFRVEWEVRGARGTLRGLCDDIEEAKALAEVAAGIRAPGRPASE